MFGMITYLIVQSAQYRFKERADIIQLLTECMEKYKSSSDALRRDAN